MTTLMGNKHDDFFETALKSYLFKYLLSICHLSYLILKMTL